MTPRWFLCAPALALAACAADVPSQHTPGLLTFVSRDSGIVGSYDPASFTQARAASRAGQFACENKGVEGFTITETKEDAHFFTATCRGPRLYPEDAAAISWDEPSQSGHVTATVNAQSVRLDLP